MAAVRRRARARAAGPSRRKTGGCQRAGGWREPGFKPSLRRPTHFREKLRIAGNLDHSPTCSPTAFPSAVFASKGRRRTPLSTASCHERPRPRASLLIVLADGEGFEPSVRLVTVQRFSKPPPSTTRPPIPAVGNSARGPFRGRSESAYLLSAPGAVNVCPGSRPSWSGHACRSGHD